MEVGMAGPADASQFVRRDYPVIRTQFTWLYPV